MYRFFFPLTLALCICSLGCNNDPHSVRQELGKPSAQPSLRPAEKTTSTSEPDKVLRPVATINGTQIDRRELVGLLIESHGLPLLQQLLLREAAVQELKRLNLSVNDADIEREYQLTLLADQFNGKDPDKLTPARKEQLINDWTRTRGVSKRELDIAMHRQAALRKIAQTRLNITDEMLHVEYDRIHGEKAEVRHIQIPAERFWPDIKDRLQKGDRFEELVIQYSQNNLSRQNLGLLPPFTRKDSTVPAIFCDVAFKLRPGEYSNLIEAEKSFHVLKLERLIPADSVPFEQEENHVRRILTARLLAQDMELIGRTLMSQANLTIEDAVIRQQYEATRPAAGGEKSTDSHK
jgi:parvulin-like peptidyl-prolyl isomerase